MSRPAALLRLAAVVALALSLAACVSLLPKQKPSLLYRFGDHPAANGKAEAASGPRVGVLRAGGLFQRESAGDRMLTLTGPRAAYIARARWVAPAEVLFEEAVLHAFDAQASHTRLVARGEPTKADYALRLDVRNFETRYGARAPTVVVRVRAVLLRDSRSDERMFEAEVRADDNRIGAIVAAYDTAVNRVLTELVAWVETSAT